jgi:hypothetical protein
MSDAGHGELGIHVVRQRFYLFINYFSSTVQSSRN